jgi:hypothetical protein
MDGKSEYEAVFGGTTGEPVSEYNTKTRARRKDEREAVDTLLFILHPSAFILAFQGQHVAGVEHLMISHAVL